MNICKVSIFGIRIGYTDSAQRDSLKRLLHCYRADSFKRLFLKRVLSLLAILRLSWVACSKSDQIFGHFKKHNLKDAFGAIFPTCDCFCAFVSDSPSRVDRIYVYGFKGIVCLGFAKISTTLFDDSRFEIEIKNYHGVTNKGLNNIKVPRIIETDFLNGHGVIRYELLPKNASSVPLSNISVYEMLFFELAERKHKKNGKDIFKTRWWRKLRETNHSLSSLLESKSELINAEVTIGFVHGDLGSHNVFQTNGDIWVIDWETCEDSAPIYSDIVSVWISLSRRRRGQFDLFRFINRYSCTIEDVVFSIAFLCSTGRSYQKILKDIICENIS